MSLFKSLTDKKYDKRMLDWNLKSGVITQAEYEQYMAALADNAGQCEKIDFSDDAAPARIEEEPAAMNGASTMQSFQH